MSAVLGCRSSGDEEDRMTASPPLAHVDCPDPTDSAMPLEVALRRRRSVREFAARRLTDAEIGQLLWAAQGVTADWGGCTAPSAGALHPLELHAVIPTRVVHYVPDDHRAEVTAGGDLRSALMAAALDQGPVGEAPLVVAVAAVPSRTARYGDRARRYVDLEAGHAAQNALLQAVAMDLVAVPIGAFDDDAVAQALALPDGHEPRYLLPIGHPRPGI
jgi:SagB-type dehydrogenase family enzyme